MAGPDEIPAPPAPPPRKGRRKKKPKLSREEKKLRRLSLRQEFLNIPNYITMARTLMIPLFSYWIYEGDPMDSMLAAITFAMAGGMDALDGFLARKLNKVTTVGKFMDPLADKLMVMSALVLLVRLGRAPSWAVILLLAREFAREANLLVLDEPTNDLDLETLDLLQEVIADYDGTVLIVSHDRDFLDRTVTVTLGLDCSGKVDIVAGGYEDWEAKRKKAPVAEKRKSPLPPAGGAGGGSEKDSPSPQPPPASGRGSRKLSYKDQRDFELLPQRIEELDAAITRGETILADPELFARDPDKFQRVLKGLEAARAEKDAAEERWLALAELAEG